MKKVIVIVVFLFLLKPILPVMEYVFNYDYIVKELCENRKKPELSCNGKCHLMKELAKTSESDSPVSSDKKNAHHEFEVLFLQHHNYENLARTEAMFGTKVNSAYSDLYIFENAKPVFHPPTV